MNKEEVWRYIDGYDNKYQISTFGNVKSFKVYKQGIILKPRSSSRYAYVSLNGKTKYVHHLVATTFINHAINTKTVIDHIDNDGQDNHLNNLQVITNRENASKERKGEKGGYKNQKKTSKYVGVYFDKSMRKWRADIKINNKKTYLGHYELEEDAYLVYKKRKEENE